MRRSLFKQKIILTATFALVFAGSTLFAPEAHAQTQTLINIAVGALDGVIAGIMNIALWVMHWFVVFAGAMLNVSINLTLHIADFVDSTPGVYSVWQTIRDISGLFIIFMLLYASFRLILSKEEGGGGIGSVGNTIKNIVIAGILINFSFFIVSVLIDASNIVSLAIYNGILGTPKTASAPIGTVNNQVNGMVDGTNSRVGLGDIFMNKLKLQTAYKPSNLDLGDANSPTPAPLKTLLQGIVGIVIMFTAAMSFLLAALAFAARLIILIVLLAFSPIWFASWIFPMLKDKSKHFTDQLYAQLVFMPVYLLLLYAAMLIITTSTIFNDTATSTFQGTVAGGGWIPKDLIVLAINDFFIIFLLNLPLVTAFSYGGHATDFLKGAVNKFGAKNVWQNVGRWTGRNAYQSTISRGASAISRSEGLKNFAANSQIGEYALKGIKRTASSYDTKLDAQVKSRTSFAESLGHDRQAVLALENQRRQLIQNESNLRATGQTVQANAVRNQIGTVDRQIVQAQNARQESFATRTNTRQVDTVWTKVARKDRVAAAKIQIETVKRQLAERNQVLERVRTNITNAQNQINTLQAQLASGQSRNPAQATQNLARLQAQLQQAYATQGPLLTNPNGTGVHDLEAQISQMESIS